MMKLNTSIFVTVFCLFFLSSSFVSGTTLSQNGDYPNYYDTRTSMEVDSDIVWLRVEGDNFFTIDKNANFISYEIISGSVTKMVDLKNMSYNLKQYSDFCPQVIGMNPETRELERSFDCLVVNGDFSPDLSRLYLSVCLGDTALATDDVLVVVQKNCEFVDMDQEFNILKSSFSEKNYSVTYRTNEATYRVYSNFTIENLETGAIGQIPNWGLYQYGDDLQIVPPYVLSNSTIVVRFCCTNPGYRTAETNVFYEMVSGNNSTIDFREIDIVRTYKPSAILQGFNAGQDCSNSQYDNPMQAPYMDWQEDSAYYLAKEAVMEHSTHSQAEEYLDETLIIPEWFMTRLDSIHCFHVDDDETYNYCWDPKLWPGWNCRLEGYFSPFDFSGEQLVYRRDVITQCTIEYYSDGWNPPKIWSCGIHDGVVYSWDSEQESEEDFPYFGLCCFLFLILAALGSIGEENQATETITKGKSKRTRKKKQKTYAGTGLTAEEVLEQVDDPLLQVLILSEGKIKSPVLEHSAPTKKEYARRCAYCKRRISGRWGVDVCDDCHHSWESDT